MTHGSIFSGIGGFDLALEWHGVDTVWQIEMDSFCRGRLKEHFPNARRYKDVKDCNGKELGHVDIITGGFPCQPFSVAGKQQGRDDERWLWPEMHRIIREVAPRVVVAENVPGLLSQEGGMVFESVCADLESEGYEVQPVIIPAGGAGAAHKRDRLWIVGYRTDSDDRQCESAKKEICTRGNAAISCGNSNPDRLREQQQERIKQEEWKRTDNDSENIDNKYAISDRFKNFCFISIEGVSQYRNNSRYINRLETIYLTEKGYVSESCVCGAIDGVSARMDKARNKRIKALGNSIVPQVAYELFGAIFESISKSVVT